jgi:hypothetical protein
MQKQVTKSINLPFLSAPSFPKRLPQSAVAAVRSPSIISTGISPFIPRDWNFICVEEYLFDLIQATATRITKPPGVSRDRNFTS